MQLFLRQLGPPLLPRGAFLICGLAVELMGLQQELTVVELRTGVLRHLPPLLLGGHARPQRLVPPVLVPLQGVRVGRQLAYFGRRIGRPGLVPLDALLLIRVEARYEAAGVLLGPAGLGHQVLPDCLPAHLVPLPLLLVRRRLAHQLAHGTLLRLRGPVPEGLRVGAALLGQGALPLGGLGRVDGALHRLLVLLGARLPQLLRLGYQGRLAHEFLHLAVEQVRVGLVLPAPRLLGMQSVCLRRPAHRLGPPLCVKQPRTDRRGLLRLLRPRALVALPLCLAPLALHLARRQAARILLYVLVLVLELLLPAPLRAGPMLLGNLHLPVRLLARRHSGRVFGGVGLVEGKLLPRQLRRVVLAALPRVLPLPPCRLGILARPLVRGHLRLGLLVGGLLGLGGPLPRRLGLGARLLLRRPRPLVSLQSGADGRGLRRSGLGLLSRRLETRSSCSSRRRP
mmetsp:Transcript_119691/g.350015  ORF Transcript_119691/g.350015 Transcript_119691/m.350015 type:complete len:454 (-) Transcript_119691:812-2173(-)